MEPLRTKIAPSLMCADFLRLGEDLRALESAGADLLHVDVMDGSFVQNYALGTDFVRQVKRACSLPLDLHLMIEAPERKLSWFEFGEGDYVSVHYEACPHLQAVLSAIRARGAKAMVALNPGTSFSLLEDLLPDLDGILVMTVNPGFAGQRLVPQTLDKIRRLRAMLDSYGYSHVEIECDGNVSFENAKKMREAGANLFVTGSSGVFASGASIEENVGAFRRMIR